MTLRVVVSELGLCNDWAALLALACPQQPRVRGAPMPDGTGRDSSMGLYPQTEARARRCRHLHAFATNGRVTVWMNVQGPTLASRPRSAPVHEGGAGRRQGRVGACGGTWLQGARGTSSVGRGQPAPPPAPFPKVWERRAEPRRPPYPLHDTGPAGLLWLVSSQHLETRPLQTEPPGPQTQPLSVTDGVASPRSLLADTPEQSGHPGRVGVVPDSAARHRCLLMPWGRKGPGGETARRRGDRVLQ